MSVCLNHCERVRPSHLALWPLLPPPSGSLPPSRGSLPSAINWVAQRTARHKLTGDDLVEDDLEDRRIALETEAEGHDA